MSRRARKPLLPQLIWGPQKRIRRSAPRVTVVRSSAPSVSFQRTVEDATLVAAGFGIGLAFFLWIGV